MIRLPIFKLKSKNAEGKTEYFFSLHSCLSRNKRGIQRMHIRVALYILISFVKVIAGTFLYINDGIFENPDNHHTFWHCAYCDGIGDVVLPVPSIMMLISLLYHSKNVTISHKTQHYIEEHE